MIFESNKHIRTNNLQHPNRQDFLSKYCPIYNRIKRSYWPPKDGSSVAVILCVCICGCILGVVLICSLWKHAYSNILRILPPKIKTFSWKILVVFLFLLKKIDCGYSLELPWWGGSNEYPQSMFLSRNEKNNEYPCKPQFYYIKVGFRGSILYRRVFVIPSSLLPFGALGGRVSWLWHFLGIVTYICNTK